MQARQGGCQVGVRPGRLARVAEVFLDASLGEVSPPIRLLTLLRLLRPFLSLFPLLLPRQQWKRCGRSYN